MGKNLTVKDIVDCTKGMLIIGDENIVCEHFERDTREIKKDDVFLAFKGNRVDGNFLVKDAFSKGAKVAIITENTLSEDELKEYDDKAIIKVDDIVEALQKIATKKRKLYGKDLTVIAVTGSVGKTSTKDILASVISQKYKVLKTQGNYNNHIGVPLTILGIQDEEVAVVEMGMNHFNELSVLSKIAKPDIGVITNIGTSHIGNLGSRENILKAKLEILDGMQTPFLVINNDNDLLHNWYEENKEKLTIKTYGTENESEIKVISINLQDTFSEFTCNINGELLNIKVPIGGKHYVLNALCAVLIGKILNLSNDEIKQGIEEFKLTKKRMEVVKLSNGAYIINDSYNASYESMTAAIEYLANMEKGRKIAVLGDMFELGEFSNKLHKQVGEKIVEHGIDILICSGENSRFIVEEAIEKGFPKENAYYFENLDEIEKYLTSIIQSEDKILIKASNGMKYYELAEKIKLL